MAMRLTGMNSGLDTESIIQELVAVRRTKVETAQKEQKKLEWKQEAWKDLNSKIKSFQNKFVSNMRLSSDYAKKTTKVSNSDVANVITAFNNQHTTVANINSKAVIFFCKQSTSTSITTV